MKKTFKANTQWMAEKYEEMNQKLFNGLLGNCNFEVFTKGKGYKRTFRTWRYWNVADTNWIVPLMNHGFKIERIYTNPIKS